MGDENIKHYTAADIQRYLEGGLSAAEMHALEKAAMDDPFLADAIEGIQYNLQQGNPGSLEAGLLDIKKRLQDSTKGRTKNKIILLSHNRLWWRVAAALVILLGASVVTFTYLVKNTASRQDIAGVQKSVAKDSTTAPVPEKSGTIGANPVVIEENRSPAIVSPGKPEEVSSKRAGSDKDLRRKNRLPQGSDAESDKKIIANREKIPEGSIVQSDSMHYALKIHLSQVRVVDADSQPVVGAVVAFKNKKDETVTDRNGIFRLNTSGKDSVTNLVVTKGGFQRASIAFKNNDAFGNVIQLKPAPIALNEVAITDYGLRKKKNAADAEPAIPPGKSAEEKEAAQKAIPATGWQEFNMYLDKNKKIMTADSTIKGKESVSFIVNENDSLSSFRIEKSLSPAHDAEAIRLIREGPPWKLLNGEKTRITVIIEF